MNTLRTIAGAVFFYTSMISPVLSQSGERDFSQYVEALILNEKTNSLGKLIKNNKDLSLHGKISGKICDLATEWDGYTRKYEINSSTTMADTDPLFMATIHQLSSGTIQKEFFLSGMKYVIKVRKEDCMSF
jgi:hypothetical protein|tara:strand:+ start:6545 stop:6937 length:393 start_codon:yes stop_codon:yes gene_type:complete